MALGERNCGCVIGSTANNAVQDGRPNLRGRVHEGLQYIFIIFLSCGGA